MNKDPQFWKSQAQVNAPMFIWLAVHGNLCLALRHPENRGPSRPYVEQFVKQLGRWLVVRGAITQREREAAEKLEREEGGLQ